MSFISSIFVGVFLAAVDTTIITTLSAPVSASFDSPNILSWLASAHLIANAACQPISGLLTAILSRSVLIVSTALFAVGNLICGLAAPEWNMVAGSVVAGMAGGELNGIGTFVASELMPVRKRSVVHGIGNTCYNVGPGFGVLFGGWVIGVWGW